MLTTWHRPLSPATSCLTRVYFLFHACEDPLKPPFSAFVGVSAFPVRVSSLGPNKPLAYVVTRRRVCERSVVMASVSVRRDRQSSRQPCQRRCVGRPSVSVHLSLCCSAAAFSERRPLNPPLQTIPTEEDTLMAMGNSFLVTSFC